MSKAKWICRNCGQTSNSDVIDVDNEGICNLHPAGAGNHSWKRYIPEPTKKFRATWEIPLKPDDLDLNEFHISCGSEDEQGVGYFVSDRDAQLTITTGDSVYFVTLTVPTRGLENEPEYWTSANQVLGKYDGEVELI